MNVNLLSFVFILLFAFGLTIPTPAQRANDARNFWTRLTKLFQVNVTVSPSDISLYFYNRPRRDDPLRLNLGEFNGTVDNDWNAKLPTYVLAHGSGDSYRGMTGIKSLILDAEDANVFLIDYSRHAEMFYTILVTCVPKITTIIGEAVDKLRETNDVTSERIKLIGHSLGSHVVGGIGAHLGGKAEYIVGLDPAAPLFQDEPRDKRLDASDAQFVQVLHTNGGFQGMRAAVGHADFFPNGGGMNQPGCGADLFGSCAHARATALYKESLRNGKFCGWNCSSYEEFKLGLCATNAKSYFGIVSLDTSSRGTFYFDTNAKSPFATGKC